MARLKNVAAVEKKIGHVFGDKTLLETCFTHSSYANSYGGESNERLEFLGDAVLGFLVADELYRGRGGSEGDMTERRIRLVSAKPLETAVRALGLEKYLLSRGEPGEKSVSSLFEAIVAGLYLDGGIEAARKFVRANLPLSRDTEPNYKGDLQEFLQAAHLATAVYTVVAREGEAHAPRFTVRAEGAGKSALGCGTSVREAEKAAAKALLPLLKQS